MKINKTNAARMLDQAKIPYELIPYEFDENDLSAPHVAEALPLTGYIRGGCSPVCFCAYNNIISMI